MPHTIRLLGAAAILLATLASARAQSIEGTWTVSNGEKVTYATCGADYCSRIDTGPFAGRSVGRMNGSGPSYNGTVIDPETGKSYEGRARIEGNRLTLTGCVAKVFCRSEVFTR